jgi:serine/threonine protein phosphatase PrpC
VENANIDCNFSGTTTVSMLQLGKKLYTANVGDSRAILCKYKGGEWKAVPLSEDQKPDDPKEKQRILAAGGRVEAFKGH